MANNFSSSPWSEITSPSVSGQSKLIMTSYERLLGKKLLTEEDAESLYDADFIVLAHDGREDPCFTYSNRAAQDLWKLDWHDFIGMPSKYSAEAEEREGRESLLKDVQQKGFAEGCTAIRIDSAGRRFFIENLAAWNLLDEKGNVIGLAATYKDWHYIN